MVIYVVLILLLDLYYLNTSNLLTIIIIVILYCIRNHSGSVTDIIFTSNGQKLFTCDSKGVLAVYDSTHQSYPLLKLLGRYYKQYYVNILQVTQLVVNI